MPINIDTLPATCTAIPDPAGRGTVLKVTYSHNLDGETLARTLFDRYAHHVVDGEPLPDEIPLDTLMDLLGQQGAYCAEGWHESANDFTDEAWPTVWPWAQAQIQRLLPDITWNIDPNRQIVQPGGEA
ncbi:hypothetical protein [Streptomyces yangpuensis]|uniref:hypothetical protein n=1 Tax=Streptomyces yangpuensis TaxID=1648182 RepID=UPI00364F5A10